MSSLRELQAAFRGALLVDEVAAVTPAIFDDALGVSARLAIYRHHVFTSLTAALEATYPVVTRLVDRRFFGWVADRYVRAHPPAGPCLAEYGGELAAFLAKLPACAHLPWLGDVARLEWAINVALHAPDAVALEPEALRTLEPRALARLTLRLLPSVALFESQWPVDAIWRANRPGADAVVDLSVEEAARLEIRRVDDEVVFRPLRPGTFAFRATLAAGRALEHAVERALDVEPGFDLASEIRALIDERAVAA